MKRLVGILLLAAFLAFAHPAEAQSIFSRKPKANASARVPELILTLKTESDERKRASAVEELREYDAATFSEIVPVLVEVLQNDKKLNVRLEAVNSLARIRPGHPMIAPAIEKAAHDDESWRVRWQAKTSLTKLQVAGLVTKKTDTAPKKTSNEPPLADPTPNRITIEPVPTPMINVPPTANTSVPRPLPKNVVPSPATTTPAPKTPAPPLQGPSLFP